MLARWTCVLLAAAWLAPFAGAADRGQAEPSVAERTLLPIDAAAFETAAATGGSY